MFNAFEWSVFEVFFTSVFNVHGCDCVIGWLERQFLTLAIMILNFLFFGQFLFFNGWVDKMDLRLTRRFSENEQGYSHHLDVV